ncbi:hypothetical protein POVWA2_014200 [Plasmodium ovale wallikeri]|uniref:Uncharacterized protein n=1 Tax=Plasmodium ovale wallikeri TaxID=864142 RepID=A0A1A8YP91_PLAOA|nr:hypothetical protein POVWA2_014200 [Plasmodium ovale wallikeri]
MNAANLSPSPSPSPSPILLLQAHQHRAYEWIYAKRPAPNRQIATLPMCANIYHFVESQKKKKKKKSTTFSFKRWRIRSHPCKAKWQFRVLSADMRHAYICTYVCK